MSYIDTSAIVAALDPSDPRMSEARRLLDRAEARIVSDLVVAELASVISRRTGALDRVARVLGKPEPVAVAVAVLYILKRFKLKQVSVKGRIRLPYGEYYKPLAYTVTLAGKLKLKTLDLLHLSYIKAMKQQGVKVNTLLTADEDFARSKREIQDIIGVKVQPVT